MGQIFHACAYDTETKTCCVYDADKFHANCYAHSGAVVAMHYLLRQKPYRIMWGGGYTLFPDNLAKFTSEEDLLGLSTYWYYSDSEINNDKEMTSRSDYDKIKIINENSKQWKRIDVWDEALRYFDWDNTYSVAYRGYLINHTKKLAIDLADYHSQSKYIAQTGSVMSIDLLPILTETGESTAMALFDGVAAESTEELACQWCGDLLQIVDAAPENYQLVNCCFAEIWSKVRSCYRTFGVNKDGLLLKGNTGELFEAAPLLLNGQRGQLRRIKVEIIDNKVRYRGIE